MEMFQFVSALKWLKERNYNATIASFVDDLATNDFALASSPNISLPKESHDSHVIKKRKLEDGKITKQVVASSSESGNGSDEESNDDSKSSSSSESDTSESDDSDSDDESDSEQRKLASKKKALESLEASKSWLEKASITPSKEKHLPGSGGPKVRNSGEAFKRVDDTEWSKQIKTGLEDNSYEDCFGNDGYGAKANKVLSTVTGKDFRHEKTKRKRGNYRGGNISLESNSFKYSD